MKDWYRVEGGRKYLADFPEKGLTDLSLISGKFCNWAFGGLKLNKNYDTTTNYIVWATLMM